MGCFSAFWAHSRSLSQWKFGRASHAPSRTERNDSNMSASRTKKERQTQAAAPLSQKEQREQAKAQKAHRNAIIYTIIGLAGIWCISLQALALDTLCGRQQIALTVMSCISGRASQNTSMMRLVLTIPIFILFYTPFLKFATGNRPPADCA